MIFLPIDTLFLYYIDIYYILSALHFSLYYCPLLKPRWVVKKIPSHLCPIYSTRFGLYIVDFLYTNSPQSQYPHFY